MKKRPSRQDTLYAIALAGISTALSLLLTWLGVVVRFGSLGFFAAAGIALMVPITKRYYLSSVFAYVASAVLAFFIVGDIASVAGFIVYFAPMSVFTAICREKKLKLYISIPIKIIFINGALALLYFVFGTLMIDESVLGDIHYAVIAVVGTVVLLAIDFLMQYVYATLKKVMSKVLRSKDGEDKNKDVVIINDDGDNPFEGDSPFAEVENSPDSCGAVNGGDSVKTENSDADKTDDNDGDGGVLPAGRRQVASEDADKRGNAE